MNRPSLALAAALLFCAGAVSPAKAFFQPRFSLWENGQLASLNQEFTSTAEGYSFRASRPDGFGFNLNASTLANPYINYSISALNTTDQTQTFTFIFITPVPQVHYYGALNQLSVSVSDVFDNGAFVRAHSPETTLAQSIAGSPDYDLGIDIGEDCLDEEGGSTTRTCDFPDASNTFAALTLDKLQTTMSFELSAQDKMSAEGHTELYMGESAVPEPASLSLMAAGIGAFLAGMRRRKCG